MFGEPPTGSASQMPYLTLPTATTVVLIPSWSIEKRTGTKNGDASEAAGLRTAFGEGEAVASSVKGATGHLMGAAGALNAALAALAVSRGAIPPTLNLNDVDPDCQGVDWVPNEAREAPVYQALALARGLEGQNVALVFREA